MTPGTVLDGRYRLLAVIGEGGMARVFRAEDLRLRRTVALKIMHPQYLTQPDYVRRFEQEARLAAGLSHPNIIAIYDVGRAGAMHYIVMEYVGGGSLRALIARAAPLPLGRVLPLMQQLGDALDAAHARGVIHRDIKPENILLTPSGQIKVGDFGIARALAEPRQTATGMVLGSVSYVSPEQARGHATSAASDLYSSGVVLYELLTGQPPFAAETQLGIAMQHVTQQPAPLSAHVPTLPPALDEAVLRALSKDPAARFPSGAAMATALAVAGATPSIHSDPTLHMERVMTPPFHKRWIEGLAMPMKRVAGTSLHITQAVGLALVRRVSLWALLLLLLGGSTAFAAVHEWGQGTAPSSSQPPTATRTMPPTARRVLSHRLTVTHTMGTGLQRRSESSGPRVAQVIARRPPRPTIGAGAHRRRARAVPVRSASPTVTPRRAATATVAPRPSATATARHATATPPRAATATEAPRPSATASTRPATATPPRVATATVAGTRVHGPRTTAATASLRVTEGGMVARTYMSLQHVPARAAVAVRWTFPNGRATVWQAGRAYNTHPYYWAYQLLAGPGRYRVAVLVNGRVVGMQDFIVAGHASRSPTGNRGDVGRGHRKGHGKAHRKGHGEADH